MRIAIMPMKAGSRRIPRKNWVQFLGRPIYHHPLTTALTSGLFNAIIVSTDDPASIKPAEWKDLNPRCPVYLHQRSPEDAADEVGTQKVAKSVLLESVWPPEAEPVTEACVIYATAVMLERTDLWFAHEMVMRDHVHFAVGVGTNPLCDAGMFYYGKTEAFLAERPLYGTRTSMIPINDERVCDINEPADLARARELFVCYQEEKERCQAMARQQGA